MGNLFGRSKSSKSSPKSKITEQDHAVLELKKQRDKLKQYQRKVAVQLEKDRQMAKNLLAAGKKERAKLLLRKKKFQESLLSRTDGQLDNIEQMVHDLEFAQIETQVVEGLKQGNEALKKMHELLSIEDVEKIMDETEASVEYQREIDSILAGGLTQEDEDDVLAELEDIIQQSNAEGENINLPDVPQTELPAAEKEKQKQAKQAVLAS